MVKNTGIKRYVDELGRIVVPIECKKILGINIKDSMEIFTGELKEKQVIILKKYEPGCVICGSVEDCITFKNKQICKDCVSQATTLN